MQLVEISYKDDSFYISGIDQIFHADSFTPDTSEDKIISILQNAIDKIKKKRLLTIHNISFSLPNNFFKIFEIPYDDSLVKKDLIDHFKWELSILYPTVNSEHFFIQHIEVDKTTIRKEKKAAVFAINKKYVMAINKFCENNSYQLKFVDNVHLASNAFLYLEKPAINNEITLSIYIDQKHSSLSAMEGVHPFFFKVINPEDSNIFENLTDTIKHLEEFKVKISDFKRILLYGQDITPDFESKLQQFFGLPLKKVNPFERLKAEEGILANPLYKIKYNSFTAATGIAIRIV